VDPQPPKPRKLRPNAAMVAEIIVEQLKAHGVLMVDLFAYRIGPIVETLMTLGLEIRVAPESYLGRQIIARYGQPPGGQS
jgi:hypothetical protein